MAAKKRKKPTRRKPLPSRPIGRPTEYTSALGARITRLIRDGNFAEVAARSVGVPLSTYYLWMARGRGREAPYVEFMEAVEDAKCQAEAAYLAIIHKAARKRPEFAKWWLEHARARRWSQQAGPSPDEVINAFAMQLGAEFPPDVVGRIAAIFAGAMGAKNDARGEDRDVSPKP